MKNLIVILFVVMMSVAVVGCGPEPPRPLTNQVRVTDYGNGVYVLPFGNFPNRLSAFIAQHPDRRITTMYAGNEGGHGMTESVVLVTEKK